VVAGHPDPAAQGDLKARQGAGRKEREDPMIRRRHALALPGLLLLPRDAAAQQLFPSRAVRLICPYPPGGTTDIMARVVAERLSERWGQPVVVENRAGAGGSVGTEHAARAAPDGYTLVMGNSASHGANVLLSPAPTYDPVRDFAAISMLALVRQMLVVHPAVPAQSVRELVELAKAQPGRLSFSSSAIGGAPHMAGELFKLVAGVDILHVPYNGAAPALNALLAGTVTMLFGSVPTVAELSKTGRIRALAMASATRSALVPELQTMAEAGYPGVEMDSWNGLLAPAGTPPAVVNKINADLRAVLDGEAMRGRLAELGFERATGTPEELATHVANEMVRVRRLITDAKITAG
jgi:tripartite-type tricarboxylate transporter receptor subunit TctC